MGPTNAGKTTVRLAHAIAFQTLNIRSQFIAHATGEGWAHVEHSLMTRSVNPVRSIPCKSTPEGIAPVTFVDTPGFEDAEMSEIDGLFTIANWLKKNL